MESDVSAHPTKALEASLEPVYHAATFGEACEELGKLLELGGPAPAAPTARALADLKFATYLAATRKFPEWRDRLMNDPMNERFDPPTDERISEHAPASVAELFRKSAVALTKWGATGFQTVEPWILEHRRRACLSCEHLSNAPNTVAYQVAAVVAGDDKRICDLCGCLYAQKSAIPTERCPAADPADPTRSRWGDPMDETR